MRQLYRAFWRLLYRNPEYLKYSGKWDCRLVDGEPVRARWYHLGHWVNAFRDEWFMFTHPEFDQ